MPGDIKPNIDNRIYRIPGSRGLVKFYERGCAAMELCLQLAEPLPDGDVVEMHKVMIDANDEEYLQKANHFAPNIISLYRLHSLYRQDHHLYSAITDCGVSGFYW